MYDVIVIGAGIIGGAVARELMRYQLSVCILEKENDVATGATKANSAIVHAGFDAKEGSMKAKMNVRGSHLMEKNAKELHVKYKNNGSMVIGFSEKDEEMLQELFQRGVQNGVQNLRLLTGSEAIALEPNLNKNVTCALYAPTGAIVCPYELAVACVGNAMDNGAHLIRNFEVKAISRRDGCFIVSDGKQQAAARYLVNAAGLFADEIAKMAGDCSFHIHPRKGEYLLLDKTEKPQVSHTIFTTPTKMGKGILVSPTVDNNTILGPTSEDALDKTDTATTANGLSSVLKRVPDMVDGVQTNTVITSFCGLRAVGDTGDFIINNPIPNFINAAAIESPGLSSAFAIAEYVAGLLKKAGLALYENSGFNPNRPSYHEFRQLTMEEKNKVIKKDSAYGRIICRCEQVTEGEILEAIRRNPAAADLDGVKRRTRSGMGRCQGGFCSTFITELLAREQHVDFGEITKCGKGSKLSLGKTKEVRQ